MARAAALSALASGARLQAETVGGIAVSDLQAVVDQLKAAQYSVVTWAAGMLDFGHAELTVQQLCKAVVALTSTTRSRSDADRGAPCLKPISCAGV